MDSLTHKSEITGLILAGGAGRRVDRRDKGLIEWQEKPLVEHVLHRLATQVGQLLISCNRNIPDYKRYGVPTVLDTRMNFQGPLAGLEAASQVLATEFLIVVACDIPLLPLDLVPRLISPLIGNNADIPELSYAHDGTRGQYLCAAMRRRCLPSLTDYLEQGHRTVHHWYENQKVISVDFSDQKSAFSNFNKMQ